MVRGEVYTRDGVVVIDLRSDLPCRDISYDIDNDGSIEVRYIKENWEYNLPLFEHQSPDPDLIDDRFVANSPAYWKKTWYGNRLVKGVRKVKLGWIKYKTGDKPCRTQSSNWRIIHNDK